MPQKPRRCGQRGPAKFSGIPRRSRQRSKVKTFCCNQYLMALRTWEHDNREINHSYLYTQRP